MPQAKYIVKNHRVSAEKWMYLVYDKSYKNIYSLTLTPKQAKKLPLKILCLVDV